ncbi:MAG TPA: hypothetical protein PLY73_04215, partial [Candidatus Ozemobacteraceae bacterium]|nr:hypothetical protein [Candidatus Ozemobacteraceae bacterium]
ELAYFESGRQVLEAYTWPGNFRELVSLVNLRLRLGRDVIETVRTRSLAPLSCGAYAPPAPAPHPAVSGDGLELAMDGLVNALDEIVPADDVERLYAKAVKRRWNTLSFRELARRLNLAENTLRKRI